MKRSGKDEKTLEETLPGLFLPGGNDDRRNRRPPIVLLQDEAEEPCRASPPMMNSDSDCACE
jgi:hypothetical protein